MLDKFLLTFAEVSIWKLLPLSGNNYSFQAVSKDEMHSVSTMPLQLPHLPSLALGAAPRAQTTGPNQRVVVNISRVLALFAYCPVVSERRTNIMSIRCPISPVPRIWSIRTCRIAGASIPSMRALTGSTHGLPDSYGLRAQELAEWLADRGPRCHHDPRIR
jgi:hypothetical protein